MPTLRLNRSNEPVGESCVDEPLICGLHLRWHLLLDCKAAFGVLGDALGVPHEHVDDALGMFLAGGEGAPLLIWTGNEENRFHVHSLVG